MPYFSSKILLGIFLNGIKHLNDLTLAFTDDFVLDKYGMRTVWGIRGNVLYPKTIPVQLLSVWILVCSSLMLLAQKQHSWPISSDTW